MANITEWIKGITFFLFITILFYFFWDNIFSNLLTFSATDYGNLGTSANTSYSILKGMAWVSFIILYLGIGAFYLIYSIIIGGKGNVETKPLYFFGAIGAWAGTLILANVVFIIISALLSNLPVITFSGGMQTLPTITCNASGSCISTSTTLGSFDNSEIVNGLGNWVWLLYFIVLIGMYIAPIIMILKGYGVDLGSKGSET